MLPRRSGHRPWTGEGVFPQIWLWSGSGSHEAGMFTALAGGDL